MKKMNHQMRVIVSLILTALFAALYFYVTLPAINIHSTDLYFFLIIVSVAYYAIYMLLSMQSNIRRVVDENGRVVYTTASDDSHDEYGIERDPYLAKKKQSKQRAPLYIAGVLFLILILGTIGSSPVFHADAYSRLIVIETGNFEEDIAELSFDQIPWLDRASAQRIGDRRMGELADIVSQFEVSSDYIQINFNGRPVRVTPLLYGDIFKWYNNFRDGIPAYIMVDMVTQEAQVVRLGEGNGIRYSQSELFFRNIDRHLRFNYPTYIFATPVMEIDETGHPYWIAPRIIKRIGLFGGADVNGVVIVNAVTGEHAFYPLGEIPEWVDNVFPASLLIRQYNYFGAYSGGFLNSIFGQSGVTRTTAGVNFLAMNDDIYMYTGITSVGRDESNIGFVWINQRTKEARFYQIAGASESSAMASAEGALQHLRYRATFPLLLNIHGEPTYFMAMKDNHNLVKQFAMVNVAQHTIVGTGETLQEAMEDYIRRLYVAGVASLAYGMYTTGHVADIRVAVIDGNSHYFIQLSGDSRFFVMSAGLDPRIVLVDAGDYIKVYFLDSETQINFVRTFEWVNN